jgi:hypothetical protein
MEAIYSSEQLADFQQTAWRDISEDINLHNHRCDNLKSYMDILFELGRAGYNPTLLDFQVELCFSG